MKKFTRLWQLMVMILLSSSIAFAQTTVQDAQKGKAEKDYLLKQKQIEQPAVKTNSDGSQVQSIVGTLKANEPTPKVKKSVGNDPLFIKNPAGQSNSVKGELDCPAGSQFSQSAVGYTTGVTSELDPGYSVYQYYAVTEEITSMTFWGLKMWYDAGWVTCTEDPVPFEIIFYADLAGAPNLGAPLATYTPTLAGFNTGELFAGSYPIYRYTYDFDGIPETETDAWIMIQGQGATDCWFLWVDSGTPGVLSYQDAGAGPVVTTYVQSLCLGGTLQDHDVGVTAILQPNTGPGLTTTETVEVTITNFGANPESNFNVFYQVDGGTAVTQMYTGTILSGESANLSFNTTADLSTAGTTYAIHACTDLVGDGDPGNDCSDKDVTCLALYDCDWFVIGFDSYGDGWNGGSIDFYLDDFLHHTYDGPPSGVAGTPDTMYFGIYDGSDLDLVWNAGTYDSEVTYEIWSNYDPVAPVFTDGTYPTGTTDIMALCAAPPCPAPTDLFTDNLTGTEADANWTDVNAENLYDLVWGLVGFDPDVPASYTGSVFGHSAGFPGVTNYSYTMGGLTYGLAYEWYVRTDCGTDEVSFWIKADAFTSYPPPPNDECANAQGVGPVYPETVLGTTLGATVDCPGVLDWNAVWYEVELPYALNNLNLDYCGTANQETIGIVYYNDCLDCNAYVIADSYEFYDCVPGVTVGKMDFLNIPGPGTIMVPVYQLPQQDFVATFDVTQEFVTNNGFNIVHDFVGGYVEGTGTDFYPGGDNGWYEYPNYGWRNIWFYDHPLFMEGYKTIHIEFDLAAYDPPAPTVLEFALNWSTDLWLDPMMPPLPPLTIPEEDMYIGRYILESFVGPILDTVHYSFDYVIPDYCPEWVSIDVIGENFNVFNGTIEHICLDDPPTNDDCEDAIFIGGMYPQPVSGTTTGATEDCPVLLGSGFDAVWYEIELPYACNYIELDLCLDDVGATLTNTGIILMADCSCDESAIIYSTGEWAVAANCITDLNFYVEGPGTVYYPVMTDPKGDFTFDVNVTPCYTLDGKLTYANGLMTPMELDQVNLDDGIVATTSTDVNGDYMFNGLFAGTYTLGGATTKAHGGPLACNGLDVILTKRWIGGLYTFTALQYLAADVNEGGAPDGLDVIMMKRFIGGLTTPAWFAPDYVFENPMVTLPAKATQDFQTLCSGDVNGSYTPPPAPPGSVCDNAIDLSLLTSPYNDSTTNKGNAFDFCTMGTSKDFICYFDVSDGYEFEIAQTLNDFDSRHTLRYSGMCPGDIEIACVDDPDTDPISWVNTTGSTQRVWFIIAGYSTYEGAFTIEWTHDVWVPAYCTAGSNYEDEFIYTLDVGTIAAGPFAADGLTYHDYTATYSTNMTIGVGYPITVVNGTPYASDQCTVWVNWNGGFSFYDAGEEFILTDIDGTGTTFTGTITPPVSALLGPTVMRVRLNYTIVPDPCGNASYGEVHDYEVIVQ